MHAIYSCMEKNEEKCLNCSDKKYVYRWYQIFLVCVFAILTAALSFFPCFFKRGNKHIEKKGNLTYLKIPVISTQNKN